MAELIEEQIKSLEAQLEAKRKELGAEGEAKEGHEVIREVFKEMVPPPPVTTPPPSAIKTDDAAKQAAMEEQEHEPLVQHLIEMAISKDLFAALREANNFKNPHLIDDFHDRLARKYDALLQARKIKE